MKPKGISFFLMLHRLEYLIDLPDLAADVVEFDFLQTLKFFELN